VKSLRPRPQSGRASGVLASRDPRERIPRLRASRAAALRRCIEPVEEASFLDEHWERRPLVVDRDEPGRFDDLLTTEDVEWLLESGGLRSPGFRLVRADERLKASDFLEDVSWRPVPFTGMPNVSKVAREFERGATLVVQGMHHWWPALGAFCRSLEARLGHAVQANAYFTPRRAQGLPVHHDTHDVFCLQLAGEKRWLVYEPVWELPLRDQKYTEAMGQPGDPVLDVTLRPGDTLYLPRGWLHAATTSDDESLHLTIGVNVYTWLDAFRAALNDCATDVAFRRAPAGEPAELLEALRARLTPGHVERRRREKLIRTRRPILEGQFEALRALTALDLETELERRETVLALLEGTRLSFEGTTLEFPEHVRGELEFVLAADAPFRAADIPGPLDKEGRLALVRRLVREGLLRPTG
jgi:ribosomal protein L16 Arg81 hydroxylase